MNAGALAWLALVLATTARAECVACLADASALTASYSEVEWTRLRAGEVVTSEAREAETGGGERATVSASGLFAATPAEAWAVITDHAAYPRFMPNVAGTRATPLGANRLSIAQHLRILFVDVRFSTLWTLDPERGVAEWRLDAAAPHDIADTFGSWHVARLDAGAATLVRYRAHVDTGRPVPGPLERLLTRSSLPRVVESVRAEVRRRYGP